MTDAGRVPSEPGASAVGAGAEQVVSAHSGDAPSREPSDFSDQLGSETNMNIVNIEDDEIVIRVPIHALPDAALIAFERHYGFDVRSATVVNPQAFALDLLDHLRFEDENGDTFVTRMLDAACLKAEQYGAEGLAR